MQVLRLWLPAQSCGRNRARCQFCVSFIHLKYLQRCSQSLDYCSLWTKNSIFSSNGQGIVEQNNKNYSKVFNSLLHKPRILSSWKSCNVPAKHSHTEPGLDCGSHPLARAKQVTLHHRDAKYFIDENVTRSVPEQEESRQ